MRRFFLKCVVFLTLLTSSVMLLAADVATGVANASVKNLPIKKIGTTGPDIATVVFGLLAVIALILLLGFLVKRFNPAALQKNTVLNVLASQSLGQRERIVLVSVGEQQLLLGVTGQQITLLHTLAEPLPVTSGAQSPFAMQLQNVLTRRGA